ncbi:MAG: thermonuclease family protein [Leptolyngbyaceae cyanobacterium SM1_3_5]|nr:thermonuclease family protein [Leptolyngbyaceae cyanobacterium SM1_3_5]
MNRSILIGLLCALLTGCSTAQAFLGTSVISTGDGDTLHVRQNGQDVTVRLACIDAPERRQPGGQFASDRLRQLLPVGRRVQLRTVETDRYGRTVGEVYANGRSINLQLVTEGQAVVYPQYLSGCQDDRDAYLQAEQAARRARRGFWSQRNPVMPWDWRRQQRSS